MYFHRPANRWVKSLTKQHERRTEDWLIASVGNTRHRQAFLEDPGHRHTKLPAWVILQPQLYALCLVSARDVPPRPPTDVFHCCIIQLTRKHQQPTSHSTGGVQSLLSRMLKRTFRCISNKCKSRLVLPTRRPDPTWEDLEIVILNSNAVWN